MPTRLQIRRDRPWQTVPKAILCTRRKGGRGLWSNPFALQHRQRRYRSAQLAEVAVLLYEACYEHDTAFRAAVRRQLAGKDLACWCPLDTPYCHVEVLLRWANTEPEAPRARVDDTF
jgi:uncharacterized protein DUF4326